ncbi:MAG: hypothetical protein RIR50_585, partial [Pseudomonadota bacterium]
YFGDEQWWFWWCAPQAFRVVEIKNYSLMEINSLVEIHSLMTELKKVKNDKKYGQAFRE